jgi:hypothetical protein
VRTTLAVSVTPRMIAAFLLFYACAALAQSTPIPSIPAPTVASLPPPAQIEDSTVDMPISVDLKGFVATLENPLAKDQNGRGAFDVLLKDLLKLNGTARVEGVPAAAITKATQKLDQYIYSVSFSGPALQGWHALARPIKVEDGAWLTLHPSSVRLADIQVNNLTASATAGITARPVITLGPRPQSATLPIPTNPVLSIPTPGFHVALQGDLPFDVATTILSKRVVGQLYPIAGYTVKITSARVYGAGDITIVKLGIDGTLKGTVYLQGIPTYDALSQILYVENPHLTLHSANVLAAIGAAWLSSPGFVRKLAAAMRFPLSLQIQDARNRLEQAINGDIGNDVKLTGHVDDLRPIGVSTTPNAFRALVVADGWIRADIQ